MQRAESAQVPIARSRASAISVRSIWSLLFRLTVCACLSSTRRRNSRTQRSRPRRRRRAERRPRAQAKRQTRRRRTARRQREQKRQKERRRRLRRRQRSQRSLRAHGVPPRRRHPRLRVPLLPCEKRVGGAIRRSFFAGALRFGLHEFHRPKSRFPE